MHASRQPIECRVYLSDGHPVLVAFDSASSADEVVMNYSFVKIVL